LSTFALIFDMLLLLVLWSCCSLVSIVVPLLLVSVVVVILLVSMVLWLHLIAL